MDRLTQLRLGLAVIAALLFAASTRVENAPYLYWASIALLVVALLLRFARRPPPR
jgi:hypothetical protein